jgi:L,D-transpeptidase YcbB
MKRSTLTVVMLLIILVPGSGSVSESLKKFIGDSNAGVSYEINNEIVLCDQMLQQFYMNRLYDPAWISQIAPEDNAFDLLDYIRSVDRQGLRPADYHLQAIEDYIERIHSSIPANPYDLMALDVMLTDAFLLLGSHLYYGKSDPAMAGIYQGSQLKDPGLKLDLILEEALTTNTVVNRLNMLAPANRSYRMMERELLFFQDLERQPWPAIISEKTIKPGDSSLVIPLIRERLSKLRYSPSDTVSLTFDEDLVKQVKLFQNDRGLNTDGVIGKETLKCLNFPPSGLADQLKVNMERFRWRPSPAAEKRIVVNIANCRLDLIDGNDTIVSMRAIVGRETRRTPVLNGKLTYIVFNPSWTVPKTILEEDVIPELLKGPEYLTRKNLKLLNRDGSELAYDDVDWVQDLQRGFPFMIRQDPGPENALGRVKFMFPNNYDVYIHDTPSKAIFSLSSRAVSSGCVRVENPLDLAAELLSDAPGWSADKIREIVKLNEPRTVFLKKPVEVELVYITAWIDGNGRVQFRNDIYQDDVKVLEALNGNPAGGGLTAMFRGLN